MGDKDRGERIYLKNPAVFADACNYALFGGKEIIKPESLREQDTNQLTALINKDIDKILSGRKKPKLETYVERFRDIYNEAAIMSDGDTTYVLIGIEAQTASNRAMAVRIMLADALSYTTQVHRIRDLNLAAGKIDKAEFIAGLLPEDRIRPVVSLVILFSPDEWNAPRSISELFESYDSRLVPFIQDYHINLIAPSEIDDYDKFRSTLGPLMEFLKNVNDKDALQDLLERKKSIYANLDSDAARVLGRFTDINLQELYHSTADKEGGINMLAGWEAYVNDRVEKGVKKGIQERLPEAVAEALPEAVAEALPEAVAEKEQEWQMERAALTAENARLLEQIAMLQQAAQ